MWSICSPGTWWQNHEIWIQQKTCTLYASVIVMWIAGRVMENRSLHSLSCLLSSMFFFIVFPTACHRFPWDDTKARVKREEQRKFVDHHCGSLYWFCCGNNTYFIHFPCFWKVLLEWTVLNDILYVLWLCQIIFASGTWHLQVCLYILFQTLEFWPELATVLWKRLKRIEIWQF